MFVSIFAVSLSSMFGGWASPDAPPWPAAQVAQKTLPVPSKTLPVATPASQLPLTVTPATQVDPRRTKPPIEPLDAKPPIEPLDAKPPTEPPDTKPPAEPPDTRPRAESVENKKP